MVFNAGTGGGKLETKDDSIEMIGVDMKAGGIKGMVGKDTKAADGGAGADFVRFCGKGTKSKKPKLDGSDGNVRVLCV